MHDPAGNILGNHENVDNRNRQQSNGNRLAFYGDNHYTYDDRGNRILNEHGKQQSLQQRFNYNALNQLESVENQQQKTVYQYDALGRRISKVNAQSETQFLWLDNTLLSETTTQITSKARTAKIYLFEPGTHKPLAVVKDSEIYHYHLDHLGTPQEITNSRGKLAWSASFKAYGNLAVVHNNEIENNLRFQGQYYDEETGLHYNRFRYYDPECGRFTSQDPIGLLGGVNNYQYVPNPTGWVDPLGLSCKEGYAVVRQYENGYQEGHFTIEVFHDDYSYNTHQVITSEDWKETTIKRAGSFHEQQKGKLVKESVINLPDAKAAIDYQKNLINTPLGEYDVINNSCLSHVVDVIDAGGGPKYGKGRLGYGKFFKKNGFDRLDSDKTIL